MFKQPAHGSFTWKLRDFSKLDDKSYDSPAFTAGQRSWKIILYPKGSATGKGKFLSMYLELVNAKKLPPNSKLWVEYKLRVVNQRQVRQDYEIKFSDGWLTPDNTSWGLHQFMPLEDLRDNQKALF